tara:strand:- start:6942 stop:7709 length:768 start_codon:yes stop_codon:yes gene_type:complete
MLKSRIIPVLLKNEDGLVKTINFKNPKYVGDPINAVRIFNEKEVDELIILDISASRKNLEPDYKSIKMWADESRMPLCYGGGIKNADQAEKIFSLGVEKVAVSSSAVNDPKIISEIGNRVGSQSVIGVLDVKKNIFGNYKVYTLNGEIKSNEKLIPLINKFEDLGVGELVINSIDRDGTMSGYDYELIDIVRKNSNVPLTVIGGASSLKNIQDLVYKHKIIGAGVGSLFVFKGKYRAVLINYPSKFEKNEINSIK